MEYKDSTMSLYRVIIIISVLTVIAEVEGSEYLRCLFWIALICLGILRLTVWTYDYLKLVCPPDKMCRPLYLKNFFKWLLNEENIFKGLMIQMYIWVLLNILFVIGVLLLWVTGIKCPQEIIYVHMGLGYLLILYEYYGATIQFS